MPRRCLLCLAPSTVGALCPACVVDLPRNVAGRPGRLPWTAGVEAPFRYTYPLDRLVLAFKFHRDAAALEACSDLLTTNVSDYSLMLDRVVPIPLSRWRYVKRSYNQASLLAAGIARQQGLQLDCSALRRCRGGVAQSRLPAAARARNVRDVFEAAPSVRGKRILLVDDVVTTGATVSEAARTLVRAGACEVRVVALAFSERA
ncbi:MAG: ComF family protein [Gammaproteobacteria bacterium]